MGLIEKIWNWLTFSASNTSTKGHPDLYPLNVAKLTKELKLLEEAKRLGAAGLPAEDAKVRSGPEARIIQKVEKARQDYIDWSVIRLGILNKDIGQLNVSQDINRARQADKEFERKASTLLTEKENLVRNLGEIAKNHQDELEAFKARHNITREANYPSTTYRFFMISALVLLVVIEGLLNAVLFAQGVTTGLIGGFAYAAILALANVTIAFILGKTLIRNIYHSKLAWRVLGTISFVIAIGIIVFMGLSIAHIRDCLSAEMDDPFKMALQAMQPNPFHLRDIFSWILFFISILFGGLALADGLYYDDKYPGYGAISRRTKTSIDDYEDELNNIRSELEMMKNKQLEFIDKVVKNSRATIAVVASRINNKKEVKSRLSTALRDADNSLEALLRIFRTENELHRQNIARPAYFDDPINLKPVEAPDFDTTVDEKNLCAQSEIVKAFLSEVQQIRACIQESFNQQFDRLKPLDTHFPRKEFVNGSNR
jgi:hypothetical protein